MSMQTKYNKRVQLEISEEKLAALFNAGMICVADLHCLNGQSKKVVHNLCKQACARQLQCQLSDTAIYVLPRKIAS